MREALTNKHWISLIKPAPTRLILTEYLLLWDLLEKEQQVLFDDEQDSLTWKWTANGAYTAKSAYDALMMGRIASPTMPQIWETKAIPKCKTHAWLLFRNKCLTADNLAKRGWPHNPSCAFCHSNPETAVQLLVACPFAQSLLDRGTLQDSTAGKPAASDEL